MIWKHCTRCGNHYPKGQRCSCVPPAQRPHEHRKHRAAVLERDGHQCVWTRDGTRCPITTGLEAAHVGAGYIDGAPSTPDRMVTLCREHHRALDRGQAASKVATAPSRSRPLVAPHTRVSAGPFVPGRAS